MINEDELVRKRQQAREQLARDEEKERLTRENNNNLTMKQVERVRSNSAKRDGRKTESEHSGGTGESCCSSCKEVGACCEDLNQQEW